MIYRLLLSFHLIAVVSWMAGILYLYRLFVYHAEETEAVVKSRFIVMEKKLSLMIMLPAALATIGFGIAMLVLQPELMHQPWMHLKLSLVVILMGMTHYAGKIRRQLEKGTNTRSGRFFRIANEIPTLLMIGIILLVIMRPF